DLDDAEGFVPIRHPAARFGIPLPWLAVLAALAIIFVFTAYAVRPKGGGGGAGRPDGVVEVGSCVTVAAVGAVVETGCDAPHEGRVVAIPSGGMYCADGAEAYADGETSRVGCVRRGEPRAFARVTGSRAISSVGRAPRSHRGGHGIEARIAHLESLVRDVFA